MNTKEQLGLGLLIMGGLYLLFGTMIWISEVSLPNHCTNYPDGVFSSSTVCVLKG